MERHSKNLEARFSVVKIGSAERSGGALRGDAEAEEEVDFGSVFDDLEVRVIRQTFRQSHFGKQIKHQEDAETGQPLDTQMQLKLN